VNSVQLWPYSILVYFLQIPSDQSLLLGMFTRSSSWKQHFFNAHREYFC